VSIGEKSMRKRRLAILIGVLYIIILVQTPASLKAEEFKPLSITMEGYDYPYQVEFLSLVIEGQDLRMGYMNIPPEGKDVGRTVLLLHGKNFFGAYWKETINFLYSERLQGYRA
jgi:hypothetical protein